MITTQPYMLSLRGTKVKCFTSVEKALCKKENQWIFLFHWFYYVYLALNGYVRVHANFMMHFLVKWQNMKNVYLSVVTSFCGISKLAYWELAFC